MNTLGKIGEHAVIRRLVSTLGTHPELVVGAGDDCAVTTLPGGQLDQVFTTDPVIENVHFLASDEAVRIGNKAVGRALSDIAAMGAQPQWILVNVVAPPSLDIGRLEGIYAGMTAQCNRFGATIIGGDLAQGNQLEIHVFATGTLPAGSALLRSGARGGDSIFVTGALGRSREGKHLDFTPCVEEGLFLRETGLVGAMMDISDGLATDLRHIMKQSGVGAELFAEQIPATGTLEQALYDGEDFELLYTVQNGDVGRLLEHWETRFGMPPACIGQITDAADGLMLRYADGTRRGLRRKAFEHFSS